MKTIDPEKIERFIGSAVNVITGAGPIGGHLAAADAEHLYLGTGANNLQAIIALESVVAIFRGSAIMPAKSVPQGPTGIVPN